MPRADSPHDANAVLAPTPAPLSSPLSASATAVATPAAAGARVCPTCGATYPADFRVCPKDAAELEAQSTSEDDPLVGHIVGGSYAIVRLLGEGGMGRVYEARHTRIRSKRFAIKTLHKELSKDTSILARFAREAEAAASIHSPYVVDVLDVGHTDDGQPFLVSELLEGKDLADYLAEAPRPPHAWSVRVARQVGEALVAAHGKGVIHRDIKPENVFLLGDPEDAKVKVIDFGISKLRDAQGTNLTKTGSLMGTPSYMAPEQARGEAVDVRTDVYAVGAMLYVLLTGQRPFDRNDATSTVLAVLMDDAVRPTTIDPTILPELEHIVQRAMAKDPALRYPDMASLVAELEPWDRKSASVSGAPVSLTVTGTAKTVLPTPRAGAAESRPELVVVLGVGLLFAAGALVSMVAGLVRLARGGVAGDLTGLEALLLVFFVCLALATPVVLGLRQVVQRIWNNSVEAQHLATRVGGPLRLGLLAYGLGSLVVRVTEVVLLQRGLGETWPLWDVLLALFSLGAAGFAWFQPRLKNLPSRAELASAGVGTLTVLLVGIALLRGPVEGNLATANVVEDADQPTSSATAKPSVILPPEPPPAPIQVVEPDRVVLAEVKTNLRRGKWVDVLTGLETLCATNPTAAMDPDVRSAIVELATRIVLLPGNEPDRFFDLLINKTGTVGADVLYELWTTKGGSEAAKRAERLLAREDVRARGTSALQIAWELRSARCSQKPTLFARAGEDGDGRTLGQLVLLGEECGSKNANCCYPKDAERDAAAEAIRARLK